jgi:hypothetical protein
MVSRHDPIPDTAPTLFGLFLWQSCMKQARGTKEMTATADFVMDDVPTSQRVRTADGGRMVVRAVLRLTGAALLMSAILLWVMPGASWESELILFKLLLSVVAAVTGLGMYAASAKPQAPQMQIDMIRREVRLLRPGRAGREVLLHRCRFADLSRVEQTGAHLRLWDEHETLLGDVTVSDRKVLHRLMTGLQDAGKLA